jgi:hypothetical protein
MEKINWELVYEVLAEHSASIMIPGYFSLETPEEWWKFLQDPEEFYERYDRNRRNSQ